MARVINLMALALSFAVFLSIFGTAFAATVKTNGATENNDGNEQPKRVRKCRHISAVDPFPSKKDYSILYPHISEVTMRTHFHSHQVAGYVGKLNTFLKGVDGAACPTDENSLLLHFVREFQLSDPLRKHAHQAYNHALYFAMLRKNRTLVEVRPSNDDESGYVRVDGKISSFDDEEAGMDFANNNNIVTVHGLTFKDSTANFGIEAQPKLFAAIKKSFGSVKEFKEKFVDHAIGHFASGWIWLVVDPTSKNLTIAESHDGDTFNSGHTQNSYKVTMEEFVAEEAKNQGLKIDGDSDAATANRAKLAESVAKHFISESQIDGRVPIAVLDVWEHAYYLDFQSKRKDYVEAWFSAVDWGLVASRLEATDFEVPKSATSPQKDYTYSVFY